MLRVRHLILLACSIFCLSSCASMLTGKVNDEATNLFSTYKAKDSNFQANDIYWLIKAAMVGSDKETKAGFKDLKGMWMVNWEKCPQAIQKAFLADVDQMVKGKTKKVDTSDKGVYTMYYTPISGSDKAQDIWLFFKRNTPLEDGTSTTLMYLPGKLSLEDAEDLSSSNSK